MKSKKLVGLFAAALLVVPVVGCSEEECTDAQGNQIECTSDAGDVDID